MNDQVYFSQLYCGDHVFQFTWTAGGEWRALSQALQWAKDPGLEFALEDVADLANAIGDHIKCRDLLTDTGKRGSRTAMPGQADGSNAN